MIQKASKSQVYMVCLEQKPLALNKEEKVQVAKELKKEDIFPIFLPYHRFGIKQAFILFFAQINLIKLILTKKVHTIHAWCTPAAAIGVFLSILTNRRLVIDSYEPHAESMIENGTWSKQSIAYRMLSRLEKFATYRAKYFVATSSGMLKYALEKYSKTIEPSSFFVKPSCTNLELFKPMHKDIELIKQLGLESKIVCVYAGKLGGIYLEKEVFEFIFSCYSYWGENFRFLLLSNAPQVQIDSLINSNNIPRNIVINKFVPHHLIPHYMALADFALNPVKPVYTKQFCTSIKDGEYWAMGLPIVITKDISDDSQIISDNNIGYVLQELTNNEYQKAIQKIDELLKSNTDELKKRIRAIAEKYRNYSIAENIYSQIYNSN